MPGRITLNGTSRINVIADVEQIRIVGYIALSASQIERSHLPNARQRNNPDPIPVTLLGQLAIDKEYQGQGYAASLLKFALLTAWRASEQVASFGVLTHPLNDGVRAFYARWGFEGLPHDPRRATLIRMAEIADGLQKYQA